MYQPAARCLPLIALTVLLSSGCLTYNLWKHSPLEPVEPMGVLLGEGQEGDRLVLRITDIASLNDGYYVASLPPQWFERGAGDPGQGTLPGRLPGDLDLLFLRELGGRLIHPEPLPVDRRTIRMGSDEEAAELGGKHTYAVVTPEHWSQKDPGILQVFGVPGNGADWILLGTIDVGPTKGEWISRRRERMKLAGLTVGTLLADAVIVTGFAALVALAAVAGVMSEMN